MCQAGALRTTWSKNSVLQQLLGGAAVLSLALGYGPARLEAQAAIDPNVAPRAASLERSG
jgi:hypothetical protein